MKRFEAPCPSCGASIEFKTGSSLVTICPYCRSAVARNDRKLEDLGKVAALAQTDTSLYVGQTGRFRDRPFEIVGHVQYSHPEGGVWDEYYASFPNDKWIWVAEAQGKFYVTQEKTTPTDFSWPDPQHLQAGDDLDLASFGHWSVAEVNEGRTAGAEGEMPFAFSPGSSHRYADLTGPGGAFATLDFSETQLRLYGGREVTLADLGLSARPLPDEEQVVAIGGTAIACPNCGGPLELKAPEQAQRLTCPSCRSLLDVEQGNLKYLGPMGRLKIEPEIPLGREGTLAGVKYTVLGFLRRTVVFDKEYAWDEYLLYNPQQGFRWLVQSDRHWSFVEPANASEMPRRERELTFRGQKYRLFQSAWATVRYVAGEFYWKVAVGETVMADDYIAPPYGVTLEFVPEIPPQTVLKRANGRAEFKFIEVNASLATYLPHEDVEKAFGVTNLPRGFVVAPNEPSPVTPGLYLYYPLFLAALIAIDVVLGYTLPHPVDHSLLAWAIVLLTLFPLGLLVYNWSFERRRWEDSEFNPYQSADDAGEGSPFALFGGFTPGPTTGQFASSVLDATENIMPDSHD